MSNQTAPASGVPSYKLSLTFNPEIFRVTAYVGLLLMFAAGWLLTRTFVSIDPHDTVIYQLFGFNHSCNLLDHEPSRTVSAMILPFWEIPFVLYAIFNFLRINHAYQDGALPRYTLLMTALILPVQLLLTVWFRIVFVWSPEVSFLGHYLPYVGFQVLLFLIAFQNALYFHAVGALPFRNNRTIAVGYMALLTIVTTLCITLGMSVALGAPILDTVNDPAQRLFFRSLSNLYFLLAVPVPLALSWMEMKRSPNHTLSFA